MSTGALARAGLGTMAVAVVALSTSVVGFESAAGASANTAAPGPDTVMGFGAASAVGSGTAAAGPVAGIVSTPGGGGYWTVSSSGVVSAEGNAVLYGSLAGVALAAPVVGMAATPNGGGYWLVASDGGIFSFGDAPFYGSMGGHYLDEPMVGMAAVPGGGGYWTVASDGGIFSFGDAPFYGSGTGGSVEAPAAGMAVGPAGYWVAYGQTAPASSVLGQQELLALLGYLPLEWSPAGFVWRWTSLPSTLTRLWAPGQDTVVVRGAIMAFEAHVGLPLGGTITSTEVADLEAAAADPAAGANPNGYTYALASENLPESLTVWHDGTVINRSAANTGAAGASTPQGTWPVYERLQAQIMTGTDPDGAFYADPVQWVSYFNGSDAVHYIARATYGSPQSLGCVELPYGAAAFVWPYMTYGTLVTVD
jgi:hypothetical protein